MELLAPRLHLQQLLGVEFIILLLVSQRVVSTRLTELQTFDITCENYLTVCHVRRNANAYYAFDLQQQGPSV